MVISETVEAVDVGAPIGPGEAEESAFLAEQCQANPTPSAGIASAASEEQNFPLPPMDDLIQLIPAGTREIMDQLFRAKFITVRRMPVAAFKTQN